MIITQLNVNHTFNNFFMEKHFDLRLIIFIPLENNSHCKNWGIPTFQHFIASLTNSNCHWFPKQKSERKSLLNWKLYAICPWSIYSFSWMNFHEKRKRKLLRYHSVEDNNCKWANVNTFVTHLRAILILFLRLVWTLRKLRISDCYVDVDRLYILMKPI